MKQARWLGLIGCSKQYDKQRIVQISALIGFFIFTCSLLVAINSDIQHLSMVNLRVFTEQGNNNNWILENNGDFQFQEASYKFNSKILNKTWTPEEDDENPSRDSDYNSSSHSGEEISYVEEGKVECDTSEPRTDVCVMYGDVRIHGNTSSVILVSSSAAASESSWKIRPYARKWEQPTMSSIKEFTLIKTSSSSSEHYISCSLNHSVPAVVFSTGGFQGNFFHELVDVLLPLFLTSHQYHGEVQFLIADYKPWWVTKYAPILTQLSRHAVVNLDSDDLSSVHCFRKVVVGLRSHRELGIDPMKTPKGHSMTEFTDFLRQSYSLNKKRSSSNSASKRRRPIKMVIISRNKSRAILNERRVVRMARGLGLKVVVAGDEMTRNLSRFAGVVNSCDVMMGVHGAGLSNMVFLPANATVIQIVPWGGLKWACRFTYGDPAVEMGLRYGEYEIGKEESSLIREYPKNHRVFKDPLSIHKQGFNAVWSTFLDKQNVRIDVPKLRKLLVQTLNLI